MSQASSRPVISVIGATGAQGGGLVRALLDDPARRFAVRALTRKPDSPAARALAAAGCEVVAADSDDRASLERAFRGSHGVFALTNFWEHFSPQRELAQAGHIAAAARVSGVAHLVWSTLEDTRLRVPLADPRLPTLMERYKVPHFDAKGEANGLFREAGVPTTFLHTSFYWDNLIHFGLGPQRNADGELVFTLPMDDAPLPGIAAEDIGACAAAIFQQGGSWIGRSVGIAGEHLTGAQMAAALSRVLPEPVTHSSPSRADYAALGFPGADDLANMFAYKRDFNLEFRAARDVTATRALHPDLLDFAGFLRRYAGNIPVPPRVTALAG
ncbi:MAG: NmrA/HSCARG family protein [Moraxellaceae bacterium]|nr:NmrA/HSCARG family protein [Moraxellaceae bacterium]